MEILTRSVITCPKCGTAAEEEMPVDACLYFYECTGCGQLLRPNSGDCCVFCSFGTVKCPPVQQAAGCCSRSAGMTPDNAVERALKRLLANGRLTGVPKRPADQLLLVALAASQIDAGKSCLESEVNERLQIWLETISEPFGIDHVTLRRMLVDSGLLTRTRSGSMYRINAERLGEIDAVRGVQPADVLAQVQIERNLRKQQRAT